MRIRKSFRAFAEPLPKRKIRYASENKRARDHSSEDRTELNRC